MVIELAVAVEAKTFAHFDDACRGEIVLGGDLLNAGALFAALNMRGDAGDHLAFVLGK